jgi:hypothetical protein
LFLSDHNLFDKTNPADLVNIADIPYPLYNDVVLKQYNAKVKEKKEMEKKRRVGQKAG